MTIRPTIIYRAGQVLFHGQLNDHVSGPIDDLSGDNGIVELRNSLELPAGDSYLGHAAGTTGQRPTAPPVGAIRWNTTRVTLEWRAGGSWWIRGDPRYTTYESLASNGDVGEGATQVSRGNHSHAPG